MIHVGTYSNPLEHLGFEQIVFTILHMMGEITDVTPKFRSSGHGTSSGKSEVSEMYYMYQIYQIYMWFVSLFSCIHLIICMHLEFFPVLLYLSVFYSQNVIYFTSLSTVSETLDHNPGFPWSFLNPT